MNKKDWSEGERQYQVEKKQQNIDRLIKQVDHIKPCAKFNLSKPSEQLKCFNYTNLQPLWAEDNYKKGSR